MFYHSEWASDAQNARVVLKSEIWGDPFPAKSCVLYMIYQSSVASWNSSADPADPADPPEMHSSSAV